MNDNDYNLWVIILTTIRNITSIICFTTLAIVFNKWWIIFFSIILFAVVEKEEKDD